ncbi:MAG: 50S ribosomal protein L13 [Patescibacteria group bacterium]
MPEKTEKKQYIIDATGKPLGRLACEIAEILRGKQRPDFAPNKVGDAVLLKNADKVKITGNKLETKIYHHYTGYIGGLKSVPMGKMLAKKGIEEIIKKTVWGMLPINKLRAQMIKELKIEKSK